MRSDSNSTDDYTTQGHIHVTYTIQDTPCLTYMTSLSFQYGASLGIFVSLQTTAKQPLCGVPERRKSVKKRGLG